MELNSGLQEALLALLCYEVKGGAAVAAIVPPKLFDTHYKDIAAAAVKYREKFKKPPGEHTLDLINGLREKNPETAPIYQQILHSLEITKEGINVEYVLAQATRFSREQRLKAGMAKAIEILQRNEESSVDEATVVLDEAKKGSNSLFDAGTFGTDSERMLKFLTSPTDALSTGIKELDEYDIGPARKALLIFTAAYGKGKTWFMTNSAKQGIKHRWRSLIITNELREEEYAKRIVQSFYSIGKRKAEVKYQRFQTDELGRFVGFEEEELDRRPSLADDDIRSFLCPRLDKLKSRAPFVIKHFPAGFCSMTDLIAYMDVLESSHGFIPDQLIVDMPDNFKLNSQYKREEIGEIYKQLKGLADMRNIAVCCPSQANREGGKSKTIRGVHASEDWSKMGTADIHITYSQTDAEHERGLARLFVDKNRSDVDRFAVLISQAYKIGQFCMDSVRMSSDYWRHVQPAQYEEGQDNEQ